jgi:hypothetical protein
VPRLGVQLGCETRGPGVVPVSDRAVLDQDARHERNLPFDLRLPEGGRSSPVSRTAEIVAWTCFVVGIVLLFAGVPVKAYGVRPRQ